MVAGGKKRRVTRRWARRADAQLPQSAAASAPSIRASQRPPAHNDHTEFFLDHCPILVLVPVGSSGCRSHVARYSFPSTFARRLTLGKVISQIPFHPCVCPNNLAVADDNPARLTWYHADAETFGRNALGELEELGFDVDGMEFFRLINTFR